MNIQSMCSVPTIACFSSNMRAIIGQMNGTFRAFVDHRIHNWHTTGVKRVLQRVGPVSASLRSTDSLEDCYGLKRISRCFATLFLIWQLVDWLLFVWHGVVCSDLAHKLAQMLNLFIECLSLCSQSFVFPIDSGEASDNSKSNAMNNKIGCYE